MTCASATQALANPRYQVSLGSMNWFEPIDNYCERLDSSFWAEPLNALSNISFIIAGLLLLMQWRRTSQPSNLALALIINVLLIGSGSFLFHTLANRWSAVADVAPITLFIHFYFLLALRTYLGVPWWTSAVATLAFFAVSPLVGSSLTPLMGSSAFYVPALIAIFGVGFAARKKKPAIARCLFITGAVFALSITYRATDLAVCDLHPQGTHARWHLLNGIVLYLLVRLYLKTIATPGAR
jgi:hypothetical protein